MSNEYMIRIIIICADKLYYIAVTQQNIANYHQFIYTCEFCILDMYNIVFLHILSFSTHQ